jgi:hypothetical protein
VDLPVALDYLFRAEVGKDRHPVQDGVSRMESEAAGTAAGFATVKLELAVRVRRRRSLPSLFRIALGNLQTIHEFVDHPYDNTLEGAIRTIHYYKRAKSDGKEPTQSTEPTVKMGTGQRVILCETFLGSHIGLFFTRPPRDVMIRSSRVAGQCGIPVGSRWPRCFTWMLNQIQLGTYNTQHKHSQHSMPRHKKRE